MAGVLTLGNQSLVGLGCSSGLYLLVSQFGFSTRCISPGKCHQLQDNHHDKVGFGEVDGAEDQAAEEAIRMIHRLLIRGNHTEHELCQSRKDGDLGSGVGL
jgi:hypothetical protein